MYGREYGTAWLASMATVLIAAAGRERDDVGVAVRYAAFSAEDAELAHSRVVDDQRTTVQTYQLTTNGCVPPFSCPADRPCFHPFTADQLIDQGAFSNPRRSDETVGLSRQQQPFNILYAVSCHVTQRHYRRGDADRLDFS